MKHVFLILLLMFVCAQIFAQGQVEISFPYYRLTGANSTQFAVWIERMDGTYVKTLFVTDFMGKGGYKERKTALPGWVERSKIKEMSKEKVDAITGATPKTGACKIVWECVDNKDKKVAPGEYKYIVEGTTRLGHQVVCSGKIIIGDKENKSTAKPEYSAKLDNDGKAIGEITVVFKP